jgi:hypothetical protein
VQTLQLNGQDLQLNGHDLVMGMLIDDNGVSCFVDDNGVSCWEDDLGQTLCCGDDADDDAPDVIGLACSEW